MISKKMYVIWLLMLVLIISALTACEKTDVPVTNESEMEREEIKPHTKPDGSKYRIAYVDYDEYLPACQQLYYILEGLRKSGWITCDKFPFSPEENSSKEMIEILSEMDLGSYIEFDNSAFYYLGYEDEDEIKKSLIKHTEEDKDIDLVLAFGTSAGLLVKSLNLSVPMLDFSATDPVTSGIIDSSTEGSGNDNIWAQVEPSMPLRQMKYYHSLIPFQKLGLVVYGDEVISGVPDVEKAADEIGFSIVKFNIEETDRESIEKSEKYYTEVQNYFHKLVEEKVDAFFLTVDLINDFDKLDELLGILYDANIPVFAMDDTNSVKNGAMLIISTYDYENVGYFIADALGKILSGETAGDLPCVYVSSPYICFNYDAAKRIGFVPDLKFLISCDEIYHKIG